LNSILSKKYYPTIYVDSIVLGTTNTAKWTLEYTDDKISAFYGWYFFEGEWINDLRINVTYYPSGFVASKVWQDSIHNFSFKDSLIYDSSNNEVINLSGFFNNGQWICDSRTRREYDEYNRVIYIFYDVWQNNNWQNNERGFYYYTEMSIDSFYLQKWNNGWENLRMTYVYYEYPDINKYSLMISKEWNGSQWVNQSRGNFKYDSRENQEYEFWELWNGVDWIASWRSFYSYNSSNLTSNAYAEIWYNENWVPGWGVLFINWMFDQFKIGFIVDTISVYYRLTSVKDPIVNPKEYKLYQNYPNPFNPTTTIEYFLPTGTHVHLAVYDILGGEIETLVDENQISGYHKITFDASNISSSLYIYRIKTENFLESKIMILQR